MRSVRHVHPAALAAALSLAVVVGLAASVQSPRTAGAAPKPAFTADGRLEQPTGYREWIYVGAPLTPNDLNQPAAPFPAFHNVYVHPADYAHFRTTGTFPDGTVIVKELVSVGGRTALSGNGYFMGEFIGLEAAVKDSTRFAAEPGGWAYFSFGHAYPLSPSAPKQDVATCNACHQQGAADDWVFTQYYPVLRAARTKR